MSREHTYNEIASNYSLWQQYVDTGAEMSREEFDAMSIEQRVAIQVEAFGPEQQ